MFLHPSTQVGLSGVVSSGNKFLSRAIRQQDQNGRHSYLGAFFRSPSASIPVCRATIISGRMNINRTSYLQRCPVLNSSCFRIEFFIGATSNLRLSILMQFFRGHLIDRQRFRIDHNAVILAGAFKADLAVSNIGQQGIGVTFGRGAVAASTG